MFDRHLRLIALLVSALPAACGGDEGSGLALAISRANLSLPLATVRIDLHTGDRACTEILQSGSSVLGSYVAEIDVSSVAANDRGEGEITGIVPQTYTLALWGFASP